MSRVTKPGTTPQTDNVVHIRSVGASDAKRDRGRVRVRHEVRHFVHGPGRVPQVRSRSRGNRARSPWRPARRSLPAAVVDPALFLEGLEMLLAGPLIHPSPLGYLCNRNERLGLLEIHVLQET